MHCERKHNLTEFPSFKIDPTIEVFIFTGLPSYYYDVKMANVFDRLPNLTELKISFTTITAIPIKLFAKSTKLVKLDLSNNEIDNFYSQSWFNLINLKELNLSGNRIQNEILVSYIFGSLSQLEKLDLSNNLIDSLQEKILGNLTNLQELNLSGNRIVTVRVNALSSNLLNLHYLNISHCKLDRIESQFFTKTPNLRTLDLSHNDLNLISSAHFENLTKLTFVDLSSNKLRIIENTFESLRLDYLDLSNNKSMNITRDSFKDARLKQLKLSNNTDLNIAQLRAALNGLKSIEELDLSCVNIGDSDLQFVPFEMQSYDLKKLNLSKNALTHLPALPNFRRIEQLDFSFNKIYKLNQIDINIPEIFEKLNTRQTEVYLHSNPLSCRKCDLDPILAFSQFNRRCETDDYYCLKCYRPDQDTWYDVRNWTIDETDFSNCDLPRKLTSIYNLKQGGFNSLLLIIIIIVVLSIFVFLGVLYRRRIFHGVFYVNDNGIGGSRLISSMMQRNYPTK